MCPDSSIYTHGILFISFRCRLGRKIGMLDRRVAGVVTWVEGGCWGAPASGAGLGQVLRQVARRHHLLNLKLGRLLHVQVPEYLKLEQATEQPVLMLASQKDSDSPAEHYKLMHWPQPGPASEPSPRQGPVPSRACA